MTLCAPTLKVLFDDLLCGIHSALVVVIAFPVLLTTSLPSLTVVLVGIPG